MKDLLSRQDYYILDEHGDPIPVDNLTWAKWYEKANRRAALDQVGQAEVSTVFLGLDHSFGDGPPILFETLVFAPREDGEYVGVESSMRRYATKEEALEGHREVVMFLRGLKEKS